MKTMKNWTNVTQAQHFCSGFDLENFVILSKVPNIFSRQTDRQRQTNRQMDTESKLINLKPHVLTPKKKINSKN